MARLTVLGIGNILMRDDGIGVRLMEAVRDARQWPEPVEFIDGGAAGLNLIYVIESARRLLVFDAADMNLAPGEHRVIPAEHLACEQTDHRLSMHDVPFVETLELCRRFFSAPPATILAVQPANVEYGRDFTPELSVAFDALLKAGIELVAEMLEEPV